MPLNIFEPRYLAMTQDALGGERLIGMVQPSDPQNDNRGGGQMNPPVYPIGCAGRITAFSETDDGRYLITLTGVSRFRIREELPLLGGYRRVTADWEPFARDREPSPEPGFDRDRFARALKGYFVQRQISADWEAIDKAPGEHLLTSIAMLCPFEASEKQALLEAADLEERARLLVALIEMATIKPTTTEETGGTRH
jgi:Lon protease-like protein